MGKKLDDDIIQKTAKEVFNIPYLFPYQRLVIANILDANKYLEENETNCEQEELDSYTLGKQIVLLPTGAGKSLCFLIPSILLQGATLVIYPLLALMQDQKRRIEECGIQSVTFRGGLSKEEVENNFSKIKNGAKIIIANPEVLQNGTLLNRLSKCNISHIVIDEAHCVSEWGDTFRPSYLTLGKIIEQIGSPLVSAFTATASPYVLERITDVLFSGAVHIIRSESDRANIKYTVYKTLSKKQSALILSKTQKRPIIFFCGTRAKTETLAREINFYYKNDIARFYHAGMEKSEKDKIEKWFFDKEDAILCATCAYGMGVDKKNIRTVIHLDSPLTAEQYIQEAGRGGRDGKETNAILLWDQNDFEKFNQFEENSREHSMKIFAEGETCRRQVLLDALGAEKAYCGGCDVCDKENGKEVEHFFDEKKIVLDFIKKHKRRFKKVELITHLIKELNFWANKNGLLSIWEHDGVEEVLENLFLQNEICTLKKIWRGRITTTPHPKITN